MWASMLAQDEKIGILADTLRKLLKDQKEFLEQQPFNKLAELSSLINIVVRNARIFTDTLTMAMRGQVNPQQLDTTTLQSMMAFTQQAAKDKGFLSPISSIADFFAMPMSYVFNREGNADSTPSTFYLILHVPLVHPDNVLDMYRYVPYPLTTTVSDEHVMMVNTGPKDIFAQGKTGEYQILGTSDLNQCFKIHRTFYCKGRQVLKTNMAKTCLGALFSKNSDAAAHYCDFDVVPADEQVYHLKGQEYLVYTKNELVVQKVCGQKHLPLHIRAGTQIGVESECRVHLEDHRIYGEENQVVDLGQVQIFDWFWDATRIIRNASKSVFQQAIRDLEHASGQLRMEPDEILQRIDFNEEKIEWNDSYSWAKWISPIIMSGFSVGSTFLGISFMIFLYRKFRSSTTIQTNNSMEDPCHGRCRPTGYGNRSPSKMGLRHGRGICSGPLPSAPAPVALQFQELNRDFIPPDY
jgi:hypothetical protein